MTVEQGVGSAPLFCPLHRVITCVGAAGVQQGAAEALHTILLLCLIYRVDRLLPCNPAEIKGTQAATLSSYLSWAERCYHTILFKSVTVRMTEVHVHRLN